MHHCSCSARSAQAQGPALPLAHHPPGPFRQRNLHLLFSPSLISTLSTSQLQLTPVTPYSSRAVRFDRFVSYIASFFVNRSIFTSRCNYTIRPNSICTPTKARHRISRERPSYYTSTTHVSSRRHHLAFAPDLHAPIIHFWLYTRASSSADSGNYSPSSPATGGSGSTITRGSHHVQDWKWYYHHLETLLLEAHNNPFTTDAMTVAGDLTSRGQSQSQLALEDRFEILKDIGDGSFGSVVLARVRTAGANVARRGTVVCCIGIVIINLGSMLTIH